MRSIILICVCFLLSCSQPKNEAASSGEKDQTNLLQEPQIPFNPKQYVCYKTGIPIIVDGKMSEKIWQSAEWTENFVDIEGDSKPKPRFRTHAKMLWDNQYFYIFAEMEEPDVWATLKKRDSVIFYDNDFEVFIDPNGDTHRYNELEINAFSTEWDLFLDKPYRDNCKILFFWDIAGLKSKTHIDGTINQPGDEDKGWSLEIAIPWAVLKECAEKEAPPKSGDQWRVNFSRVEWQVKVNNGKYDKIKNPDTGKPLPENNWVWSPQGLINMHYPEMWGFVQFSTKIAGAGVDAFVYQKEEDAKWALRQVYYQEKNYYTNHGKFSEKISDLGLENLQVENYIWPPEIRCTPNLFEAVLSNQDASQTWHISHDGRVWEAKSSRK